MSMMDGMQAKCGACLAIDGIPKALNCFGFFLDAAFFGIENMNTCLSVCLSVALLLPHALCILVQYTARVL
jgi:hypothetical protein